MQRFERLKFTGPVYRPPVEASTLLLQATVGCSHNSCSFCSMYEDTPFAVETREDLIENLKIARSHGLPYKRVFLVNGDAFVLSADRLREISDLVRRFLPLVQAISMYASISNIASKTDEELKDLRDNYLINDLYVGVESGSDEALEILNKGYTREDALKQFHRLDEAGIDHIAFFILGALGQGRWREVAQANADFLNSINPDSIWIMTLRPFPGTVLYERVEEGSFKLATELEILEETKEFLALVDKEELPVYGNHVVNVYPFQAILNRDGPRTIREIDNFIERRGRENLDHVERRTRL